MGLYIRVSDKITKEFMLKRGFTYIADSYYKDISLPSHNFHHLVNQENIKYLFACLSIYKEVQKELLSPTYNEDKQIFENDFYSLQKEKDDLLLSQHRKNTEINKEIDEQKGKLDKVVFKEKYNEAREKIISEYTTTWKDENLKKTQTKIDSLFEKNRIILLAKEFENNQDLLNKKIAELQKTIEEMKEIINVYDELTAIIDEALRKGPSVQLFISRSSSPLSKAISRDSFIPSTLLKLESNEILTIYRP